MVTSQDVMLEGKRLEEEMDELRKDWHAVNTELFHDRNRVRVSAMVGNYLMKRRIERRIYELRLRRNMVQNCYMQLLKDEKRMVHQ